MSAPRLVEFLVGVDPDQVALSWLASVIGSADKVEAVAELSRRFRTTKDGRPHLARARNAATVMIDGAKFKEFFWTRRIALRDVGPMIGKCEGLGSVLAHKGRMSYWTADAIATEMGCHVDAFIAQVGTDEEVQRLSA